MARGDLFISGIELPDDAIVVRGGALQLRDLRRNALDTFVRYGYYGVSAWAGADIGFEDLLDVANIRHSYAATTTAGDLRAGGFVVELTGPPRFCSIDLGGFPSSDVLVRLRGNFQDFVRNPHVPLEEE